MSNRQAAWEVTQQKIEFLAAIREGEKEADQGKVISPEQLEKNLQARLSKYS